MSPKSGALIEYVDNLDGITSEHLGGFFADWPNPPSPAALLRILEGSDVVLLAIDRAASPAERVAGLITAITDGVSCAYIPHLEVRPQARGAGIGSELVRRMLERLSKLYMVDLTCDPELQPFYSRLGMRPSTGMVLRNYSRQSCE